MDLALGLDEFLARSIQDVGPSFNLVYLLQLLSFSVIQASQTITKPVITLIPKIEKPKDFSSLGGSACARFHTGSSQRLLPKCCHFYYQSSFLSTMVPL